MTLINGKAIAETIKTDIAKQVQTLLEQGKKRPHLAAIIVGNDGASQTYVASKVKS
jgi:methylenetetrahydrofolate dehydrogenase (NADP+)/methenyltetrahydrofolate cyclohydrolase